MKAYKAMSRTLECHNFQFAEGETYEVEGPSKLCSHGFHFCKDLVLTLEYYAIGNEITENRYAEVEILGDLNWEEPNKHKGVTNKIKITRILTDKEVLSLIDKKSNSGAWNSGNSNSGDRNSGNRNSGNSNSGAWNSGNSNSGDRNSGAWNGGHSNSGAWNSGHSNSGSWNSGHRNSGDSNSGDWNSGNSNSGHRNSGHYNSGDSNSGFWNSCNKETGFFNSSQSNKIRVFNKKCNLEEWDSADKPKFLFFSVDPKLGYKKSFQKAFKEASKRDIELLKKLPNFDTDVFFEISGIRL